MPDARSYIVTGGAGFIGSNLIGELIRRDPGAAILCVDDCRSGSCANVVDACRRLAGVAYPGDFLARSTGEVDWSELLDDVQPTAVYDLAAITDTTVDDEQAMIDCNVEGFRSILFSCIETSTPLVYASSAATYGSPVAGRDREAFDESAAGEPNNVYGFSKWIMENLHRTVATECSSVGAEDPAVVGLRFFNVFGPGESHKGAMASLAFQLSRQILAGKNPRLFTAGEQARDQVYVMDVVECLIAGAQPNATGGVYNCGSGEATTFNDLADAVRQGLGVSAADRPTEYFEMPASVRAFYQDYTCAEMSHTKEGLGWSPRFDPKSAIAKYAAHLNAERSRYTGPHDNAHCGNDSG